MKKLIILFITIFPFFLKAQESTNSINVKEIYNESIPEFPGGMQKFYAFVYKEMKYPKDARIEEIQGRVIVEFELDTTGFVIAENTRIVEGLSESINTEALRIMRSSPKWKPAYQNDKPIKIVMTLPIIFKLF